MTNHTTIPAAVNVTQPAVQTFQLHEVTGTTKASLEEVVRLFQDWWPGADLQLLDFGSYTYQNSIVGPGGARIYYTQGRPEILVRLPGKACELLTPAELLMLNRLGIKPTRIDSAFDVVGVQPEEVRDAWLNGQVMSRAHRDSFEWHDNYRKNQKGQTAEIGSRSSNRFLRVYNYRGPTRFEFECTKKRAEEIWRYFSNVSPEKWASVAMGFLMDFVHFCNPTSTRREDCEALPWWAAMIKGSSRIRYVIPRKQITLGSVINWFTKQVAPTLAILVDIYSKQEDGGEAWFGGMLAGGRRRYGNRHHLLLAEAS